MTVRENVQVALIWRITGGSCPVPARPPACLVRPRGGRAAGAAWACRSRRRGAVPVCWPMVTSSGWNWPIALAQRAPHLLLMDEPTAGMAPHGAGTALMRADPSASPPPAWPRRAVHRARHGRGVRRQRPHPGAGPRAADRRERAGSLRGGYLLFADRRGLVIIDQHAAAGALSLAEIAPTADVTQEVAVALYAALAQGVVDARWPTVESIEHRGRRVLVRITSAELSRRHDA